MNEKDLKLAYFCFDDGGCAYYRAILPFNSIQKHAKLPVYPVRKGATANDIEKVFMANVIQFARLAPEETLQGHMKLMQSRGIKLVLEYDDDVFSVNPYSPHYMDYGTEEFVDEWSGLKVWEDGKAGFSIERNKKRLESVKRACDIVDLVTVTQPHLADVFQQYNHNVVCLPNCVDPALWNKLPLKRSNPDEIRLFWAGGCSHYIDWLHVVEPLRIVMEKYKNVKLVVMGQAFEATLASLPKDRVELYPWVHFEAYPMRVSILDPDISLIPLDDNKFNRCKSNIKWVEMAAMGIPSVVSAVSPYKEHYNGENMVMVDNDDAAWVQGISTLIDDRILAAKIGGAAQRTVFDKFDINKEYRQWLDVYKGIIG